MFAQFFFLYFVAREAIQHEKRLSRVRLRTEWMMKV